MKKQTSTTPIQGRLMPQALDAERAVIGSCIIEQDAFPRISDMVRPSSFYNSRHASIFAAIKSLNNDGKAVDLLTIAEWLIKEGKLDEVGGAAYIAELSRAILSSAHLEEHARIVAERAQKRMLIEYGNSIMSKAFDEASDVADLMGEAQTGLAQIISHDEQRYSTLYDTLKEVDTIVKDNATSPTPSIGIKTGFQWMDERGGLQAGNLIIIAGATSMGKTSFSLAVIENALDSGARICFYSLEMSRHELTARLLSPRTGIPSNKILTARLANEEQNRVKMASMELSRKSLFFDDKSTSDIDSIISSIRSLSLKKGIHGAVIDYLQVLSTNQQRQDREAQLADMARRLKNLAKDTGVWIIALSQLNRDISNPVPTIDRVRGSGQIAEAADVVLTIYRPEAYSNGNRYPKPYENVDTSGTALINVCKGRNIGTGAFIAGFDANTTRFYDLPSVPTFKIDNTPIIPKVIAPF